MKVLHITASDSNGAGIAALRYVLAQRENGIDARLLVKQKSTDYQFVYQDYSFKYIDYTLNIVLSLFGGDYLFSFLSWKLIRSELFRSADIIHLHNIHHVRMIHPFFLPKNKKYVYTLHDMWAITGNCNYNYDLCEKFIKGCGDCPLNKKGADWGFPKMRVDKTAFQWRLKRNAYKALNIVFTAPSKWLYTLAAISFITGDKKVLHIVNCIDVDTIKFDKTYPQVGEPVKLLFVGQKIRFNDRKGFKHIYGALNQLELPHELHIVGRMNEGFESFFNNPKTKIINHGVVKNADMGEIYKHCDILLLPTKQDNFPNTILESFSVATPVVAFNVGGVGDAVNTSTGYLAIKEDTESFKRGIEHTVKNLKTISEKAYLESKKYSFEAIAPVWKKVYSELLS